MQFDTAVSSANAKNEDIVSVFLEKNGWKVDESSLRVAEIDFSFESQVALDEYVTLQKAQGFQILSYIDKKVTKYSYRLLNYPGHLESDGIYINVFTQNDSIIAADICSVKIDGFIRGAVINENQVG